MKKIDEEILEVRGRLVDAGLIAGSFLIAIPLAFSLFRIFLHGWLPVHFVHIGAAAVILTMTAFRKQLPYVVRAGALTAVPFIAGIGGILTYGLLGGGYMMLFWVGLFAALAFSRRMGLIICAASFLVMVSMILLQYFGYWSYAFDTAKYVSHPLSWLNVAALSILFSPILIMAFGVIQDHLVVSLRAARNAQSQYEQLFENSPVATLLEEFSPNHLKILDANRAAVALLGWTKEEMRALDTKEMLPPESEKDMGLLVQGLLSAGRAETESITRGRDGQLIPVRVSALLTGTSPHQAIVTFEDLTERKKANELMLQTEKVMSMGGLAAGIAHEINNPLGGIIQSTEVLINRLTNMEISANRNAANSAGVELSSVQKYLEERRIVDIIQNIRTAGLGAAEIVANMLSFARKSDESASPNQLEALLDQVVALSSTDYDVTKNYDFRHIEIVREYGPGVPEVMCRGGKLKQVFFNLVRNAAEAMFEEGQENRRHAIRLRTAYFKDAGMVRVEISDNGPGMDSSIRNRIFEPFFTTKSPGKGTGLGLSVSYFIVVNEHRGTMSVESAPGEGTTFIIELPVSA